MKEAMYYEKQQENRVKCLLCPHECIIREGKSGICHVRKNTGGKLIAQTYGKPVSLHTDPVEKKPLYHFYPGSRILSMGTLGCNLHCIFCQNSDMAHASPEDYPWIQEKDPEDIVRMATHDGNNLGLAYTYNEPVIYYEFMHDVAKRIRERGLKNVMVSNGFISPEPLRGLLPWIDAFNIDLKAFTDDFYRKYTGSRIKPVQETLKTIAASDSHLEVTFLVIPKLNDDPEVFREMLRWIRGELGRETVLHLSRYFPHYKLNAPETPIEKLLEFHRAASEELSYVFIGNASLPTGKNTHCPHCRQVIIERNFYLSRITGVDRHGKCLHCGKNVQNLIL